MCADPQTTRHTAVIPKLPYFYAVIASTQAAPRGLGRDNQLPCLVKHVPVPCFREEEDAGKRLGLSFKQVHLRAKSIVYILSAVPPRLLVTN